MKLRMIVLMMVALSACSKASDTAAPAPVAPPKSTTPGGGTTGGQVTTNPTPAVSPVSTPYPNTYATPSPTPVASVALIWNGNGVCKGDCVVAAVNAAKLAGLTTRYADNSTLSGNPSSDAIATVFQDVAVWITPGGDATREVGAMSPALKTALKNYVSAGGGYVGWSAGAYAATAKIGKTNQFGLGLFPGLTAPYFPKTFHNRYGASIEKTTWFNDTHSFYFEGGPYLYQIPSSVEVVSLFDDNTSINAARTTFGSGRVFISSVSPEAPEWWWKGTGITDTDGTDEAFAADMIKWAAHLDL